MSKVDRGSWNGKPPLTVASVGENVAADLYEDTVDYPTPPSTEVIVNAACLRVRTAYRNRKGDSLELENAVKDLITLLVVLANYVDFTSGGDATKIQNAGFAYTSDEHTKAVVPATPNPPAIDVEVGVLKFAVEKVIGATGIIWFIFLNGPFTITVVAGHLVLPPANPGVMIIPDGKLHETLLGIAAGTHVYIGAMAKNTAGVSAMSKIVDDNTR